MFDLSDLYRRQSQKQYEREQCKREIRELEEKITRLKRFKSKVSTYQSEIYNMYNPFCNYTTMKCGDWKGDKYNWMMQESCVNMGEDFSKSRRKIGAMLDRVCDEITRLENKVHDKEGLLGQIQGALNSIGNSIEKLLN